MSRRSDKIKSFVLLLAFALQWAALSPRSAYAQTPRSDPWLRFDQRSALSDFDEDGLLDRASISGSGARKNIQVYLSSTGRMSLLSFDASSCAYGSLLAEDIDNDGDTDLIWTDLLHPDVVIIWLGDGTGKFDRVCPDEYARRFVLSGTSVSYQQGPDIEKGIIPANNREWGQVSRQIIVLRTRMAAPRERQHWFPVSTDPQRQPAN